VIQHLCSGWWTAAKIDQWLALVPIFWVWCISASLDRVVGERFQSPSSGIQRIRSTSYPRPIRGIDDYWLFREHISCLLYMPQCPFINRIDQCGSNLSSGPGRICPHLFMPAAVCKSHVSTLLMHGFDQFLSVAVKSPFLANSSTMA
jgi:hypothetical protein